MIDETSSDPWDWLNPPDLERFGPTVLDPEERRRWSNVILTGGLPMLWRKAVKPVREMMFAKMDVKLGDRVFLIGESLQSCGFSEELRSLIGSSGEIVEVELLDEARDATMGMRYGRGGQLGTWQWNYTNGLSDANFDVIACLQGVQHTDDWAETAAEFARIAKPGAIVMLGELTIGPNFKTAVKMDVHLQYWIEKLMHGARMSGIELAYYSPEELSAAFGDLLEDKGTFEWRGAELFWGRKPIL